MTSENWLFRQFALSPEMKNFHGQYLTQVPISCFNFIGIHENLANDWVRLCAFLGIAHQPLPHINASPNAILENVHPELLEEIERFHAEDYCVYDYASHLSLAKVIH